MPSATLLCPGFRQGSFDEVEWLKTEAGSFHMQTGCSTSELQSQLDQIIMGRTDSHKAPSPRDGSQNGGSQELQWVGSGTG